LASPSWYQFLTIAGALTIVNSILIGGTRGTLGLAVQATGRGAPATSAPIGVITGAGALAGHLARQRATWRTARQPASAPPPADS
jgi:hypothetical protein